MAKHHVFDFGWLIVVEGDGQVFALEDIRDLKDAGADTARHRPFGSVEEAKVWIAEQIQDVAQMTGQERPH